MSDTNTAPSALMLLSSQCTLCTNVLNYLTQMIKSGELSRLEVINLEQDPATMKRYSVRSVPWVKIGRYVLTGEQTLATLQQKALWVSRDTQLIAQFDHWLSHGQVEKVMTVLQENTQHLSKIMQLLGDEGTILSTRIGIGVIVEELAGDPLLKQYTSTLGHLSQHSNATIRADAFHYLGLTADVSALPFLELGKNDKDKAVREIVKDSLQALKAME